MLAVLVGALALIWQFAYGGRVTVAVIDSERGEFDIRVRAETVGQALQQASIAVRPADLVEPPLTTLLAEVDAIRITRAPRLDVQLNGEVTTIYTRATTLRAMLADAGHTLGPGDAISIAGVPQPADAWDAPLFTRPAGIVVQTAHALTVTEGTQSQVITSLAPTVGQALNEAGYTLFLADGVTPPLWTPLTTDISITIDRAREVTITADGQTLVTRSHGDTVAAVLAEVGLSLTADDFTRPALDQPVPVDAPIEVVRREHEIITEQYPIPFAVQWQAVATLPLDQVSLVQAGQPGLQARRVRVIYENGVEVSRLVEDEWQVRPPEAELRGYGTQIEIRTLQTPDGPVEYWRSATFYAVSYSPARSGTPVTAPWYGRTRSGKILQTGMIAVDTNLISLGTQLYIPGYGYASAEDTGGGVKGRLIDLGYTDEEYVSWHEYVTVYWLTPVPPADQIVWILPE